MAACVVWAVECVWLLFVLWLGDIDFALPVVAASIVSGVAAVPAMMCTEQLFAVCVQHCCLQDAACAL